MLGRNSPEEKERKAVEFGSGKEKPPLGGDSLKRLWLLAFFSLSVSKIRILSYPKSDSVFRVIVEVCLSLWNSRDNWTWSREPHD